MRRNVASGVVKVDDTWAFGQVLAVVMILANANEILHFFFGYLSRRKLKLARERQAQSEEIALSSQPNTTTFYRPRGPAGPHVSSKDSSRASTGKDTKSQIFSS